MAVRPATQLRIDNTVLWTTRSDPRGDGRMFTHRILRTRWNWQFTRELSARVIVQYDHRTTDPLLTTLEDRENLNTDLLVTYRVTPTTAIYAGFSANGQNIELVGTPFGREIERTDGLKRDAH